MFRNPYEMEILVRHQITAIAAERRETATAAIAAVSDQRLARRLGQALIRLGERLADQPECRPAALPPRSAPLDHARSRV